MHSVSVGNQSATTLLDLKCRIYSGNALADALDDDVALLSQGDDECIPCRLTAGKLAGVVPLLRILERMLSKAAIT